MTTHYESLLAKLICWGETREKARKRLSRALKTFHIDGVKSNVPALTSIVNHTGFVDATYHTGFLSMAAGPLGHDPKIDSHSLNGNGREDKELAAAIGVALLLSVNGDSRPGGSSTGNGVSPWKLHGRREQMLSRKTGSRGWR